MWLAAGLASLPLMAADETTPAEATAPAEATPAPAQPAPAAAPGLPAPAAPVPLPAVIPLPGVVPPTQPQAPGMAPNPALPPAPPTDPNAANSGGQTDTFQAPPTAAAGAIQRMGEIPEVADGFGARPTGFSSGFGDFSMLGGLGESPLRGFSYGASLTGTYDSNPSQGYGGQNGASESDFFATLGGSLSYHTTASDLSFGGSYNGGYNQYFNQSELSGFNQGGQISANYDGGPLSVLFNAGISMNDGANRYYQDTVQQISYNYALTGRYRLSAKTSLVANIGQNFTDSNGSYQNTGSFDSGVSALWRYSELTEVGPGVRYTSDSGADRGFRTTIGPTVTFNYKLTGKVSLNSRIGMDFVSYDQGSGDDSMMTGLIGLNYRASELWGMNLSLYRDAQADPTLANGTQDITNLSLSYNRKIRRATWNLGVTYEMGAAGTFRNPNSGDVDSDYFSFNTGLAMPIFANSCMGRLFMNWTDRNQSGSNTDGSFQAGFGINWSF
jgi:hypothetical protein